MNVKILEWLLVVYRNLTSKVVYIKFIGLSLFFLALRSVFSLHTPFNYVADPVYLAMPNVRACLDPRS